MVEIKTSAEIDAMREAGRVVARALQAAVKHAAVGVRVDELDEVAATVIAEAGAKPAFLVTGLGEPGGAEHLSAIGALHAVAGAMGAPVGPMEGLWWVEDDRPGLEVPREQWRWHLLLPLPAAPEPGRLEQARESVRPTCAAADRVRVAVFTEGQCVQMLHHGPFSEEHMTLKAMEEFMNENELVPNGPHHEVYLTAFDDPDPRTLLRQPVRPA